jgi:hypothetical protein
MPGMAVISLRALKDTSAPLIRFDLFSSLESRPSSGISRNPQMPICKKEPHNGYR